MTANGFFPLFVVMKYSESRLVIDGYKTLNILKIIEPV